MSEDFQLRNRLIAYGAAALIVHSLAACSPAGDENMAQPRAQDGMSATTTDNSEQAEAGTLILAFGDSLYAGYGVSQKQSLPSELEKALRDSGLSVQVQNAGVSGDTTAAGLQRLTYTLDGLKRKPDLALLGLGGNDMLRGLEPEDTRKNLTAMLDIFKQRGIPVLLTGMVAAPNLGQDYATAFNGIYPDLAQKYGAGLYPFLLDGVITDSKLMQADHIHPTAEGIDKIVAKLAPQVEAMLDKQADSEQPKI